MVRPVETKPFAARGAPAPPSPRNQRLRVPCMGLRRALKPSGTMKILAASEYEAFESGSHGLFTKHLLNWLDNGQSLSSEAPLTRYLEECLNTETGGWQQPVLGFI